MEIIENVLIGVWWQSTQTSMCFVSFSLSLFFSFLSAFLLFDRSNFKLHPYPTYSPSYFTPNPNYQIFILYFHISIFHKQFSQIFITLWLWNPILQKWRYIDTYTIQYTLNTFWYFSNIHSIHILPIKYMIFTLIRYIFDISY